MKPGWKVLDPNAGIGKIHLLAERCGIETVGIEIELDWACAHPRTLVGNAFYLPFKDNEFDAICVSPVFGNRMSDHHDAKDASKRITYRHMIEHELHPDNTGQLQWGATYRDAYKLMWTEAVRVMKPEGVFILNCLAGETRVITDKGRFPIRELSGSIVNVLSTGGRWVPAPIRSFGKQPLLRITMTRGRRQRVVYATAEHQWFIHNIKRFGGFPLTWNTICGIRELALDTSQTPGSISRKFSVSIQDVKMILKGESLVSEEDLARRTVGRLTSELEPGDHLASIWPRMRIEETEPSAIGVVHGIVWGDGSHDGRGSFVDLFGEKDAQLLKWFACPKVATYRHDSIRVSNLPGFFKKQMPDLDESYSYLLGFMAGWFAADGHADAKGSCTITSVDRDQLEYARTICDRLGIITYSLYEAKHVSRIGSDGKQHTSQKWSSWMLPLDSRTLSESFFLIDYHRDNWVKSGGKDKQRDRKNWIIDSVEVSDRFEEVYCAVVPGTHKFALEDHLMTGNCKDHIRKGKVQRVTEWHVKTLESLGLYLGEIVRINPPNMGYGENGDIRVDYESVISMSRGFAQQRLFYTDSSKEVISP